MTIQSNRVIKKIKSISRRTMMLGGIGILILSVLLVFWLINSSVLSVEVAPVHYGSLVSTFETKGRLQSRSEIEIQSKESGLISRLLVARGEKILANAPLVEYDIEDLRKQYGLSKALYKLGGESKNNFLKFKKRIENYDLVSPFNAVVLDTYVGSGYSVKPGDRIVKLADQDQLQVMAEVDETDVSRIKVDQKVEITSESARDKSLVGKVSSVDHAASFHENRSFFRVIVELQDVPDSFRLQLGSQVTLRITTDEKETQYIPLVGLVMKDNRSYVWKSNGSRAQLQEVQTGIFNTQFVEILNGVSKDDRIILDHYKLKPGARISVSKR